MGKNIKSQIFWFLSGVIGLAVFILFFNQAFPIASVDLKLKRGEAIKKAQDFVLACGFDLKGFDRAIIFDSDSDASIYLQKTQGIKRCNELIRQGIPVWFWRVRWFKELEKEGFSVFVDPSTGKIVNFYYSTLEDAKGKDLTEEQARAIAQNLILRQSIDLKDYELKDSTTKKQKQRTDYYFSWEKRDFKVKDATLRLNVNIYGDRLGNFYQYLKVPEVFSREIEKEKSVGTVLFMVSGIFGFLLLIAAIFALVVQHKQNLVKWKLAIILGLAVTSLTIVNFINSFSLFWIGYTDTMPKIVFVMIPIVSALIGSLIAGLMAFVYVSAGDSLSRSLWQTKMPLIEAIINRNLSFSNISPVLIVGYSLGFIFLGYVTLFYLIGTRFFNIWMPPESEYSNVLATAMPFLFPLTVAAGAAINEEFTYRLFAISFLKKYTRLIWLAVLVPALIWAFSHSTYEVFPMYVRGIELTVFGVILSMVFLKYGVETVIIAHFVIDAWLAGLPLLMSHNLYFIISGIIVIILAFIPIPVLAFSFKNKK